MSKCCCITEEHKRDIGVLVSDEIREFESAYIKELGTLYIAFVVAVFPFYCWVNNFASYATDAEKFFASTVLLDGCFWAGNALLAFVIFWVIKTLSKFGRFPHLFSIPRNDVKCESLCTYFQKEYGNKTFSDAGCT